MNCTFGLSSSFGLEPLVPGVYVSATPTARRGVCFLSLSPAYLCTTQGVKDWEAVLQKAKGMFLKRPPRELVLHAPAYMKETLVAGG